MKTQLLSVGSKNPGWVEEILSEYDKKISFFFPFSRKILKSKSSARDEAAVKKSAEAKEVLAALSEKAVVVLLDEKGKQFKNSEDFSKEIQKLFSSTANEIVFVIGGAYGVTDEVRKRARATWSLSGLTFNHHLVQVVFCEQLYRALTIWRGVPYHN